MTTAEKASAVSVLSHLAMSHDAGSALDLERMVRRPRNSQPTNSAVTARMLVGAMMASQDTGQTSLCMDVDGELVAVQVAESCLLRVEVGDWVHAVLADGVVWVLAVLKKHALHASGVRQLDFGESELHISAQKICMTADKQIGIHAPLLTQAAKNRQSQIEGTDSARVGNSIIHADSHLSLHARSAMVTAASLLKVDAAQIHMG